MLNVIIVQYHITQLPTVHFTFGCCTGHYQKYGTFCSRFSCQRYFKAAVFMEAGLDRLARQPGKQDLTALGIIYLEKIIMCLYGSTSRLALLPQSCLLGWKFLHINTHKQAGPGWMFKDAELQPIFNNCQNGQHNKIVPASRMIFSHTV